MKRDFTPGALRKNEFRLIIVAKNKPKPQRHAQENCLGEMIDYVTSEWEVKRLETQPDIITLIISPEAVGLIS